MSAGFRAVTAGLLVFVANSASIARAETVKTVTQISYDSEERLLCTAVRMKPAVYDSLPTDACLLSGTVSDDPDRITKNIYDAAGQVTQIIKALGVTTANGFPQTLQQNYTTYTYSLTGKRTSVTDANGNFATMSYDGYDREVAWAFPSTTTPGTASATDYEQYGYDSNGNRTLLRKRDGRTINYAYDALNRLTVKSFASGGACLSGYACAVPPAGAVRSVYYSYDLRGLQTAARFDGATGSDAVVNAYDALGRLTSSTVAMGGVSRTVSHLYDVNGNRVRVTHPDGNYFTYDYDGLNRPIAIRESGATQVASFGYDAQGRTTSEARGAVLTTYGYDAVSRLTSLSDDLAGTTNDVTATFAYNPANQIVTETRDNALYAFNAYTTASNSYTANGLNQYTAVGAGTLGYDSNGNLMSNGGTTFAYDVENRLVAASGTLSAALVYDPLGRLFSTAGRQYLYDGDELIGEFNGAGPLVKRYVHGNGEDDPLLWYAGAGLGTRYSLQADHQGSIVSIADATGAILAAPNSYDEYGVPGSGNAGTFQYTGQMYLSQLGMYYYKARIYSSRLGRFLQTDPIGYEDQVNLYAYVGNDPANRTDPTGQQTTEAQVEADADQSYLRTLTPAQQKEYLSLRARGQVAGAVLATAVAGTAIATDGFGVPALVKAAGRFLGAEAKVAEVGTSFGKLGTVVEAQGGRIAGYTIHGSQQAAARGVSTKLAERVVSNPTAVLSQSGGKTLYATNRAVVVLSNEGNVVTAYGRKFFDAGIKAVLGIK